ncbi:MAG: hypothetical protein E3J72_01925 [Planctomycetota bacterium]|nr:MAG: hypothetical protein E3J72_01925 [Planctomycetota bacterium]
MSRSALFLILGFAVTSLLILGGRGCGDDTRNPVVITIPGPSWSWTIQYPNNTADKATEAAENVVVDEAGMDISFSTACVSVGIPVTNNDGKSKLASLYAEVRDAETKYPAGAGVINVNLQPGETYAVVNILTLVADASTAKKAGHFIYWRIQIGTHVMKGQKALISGDNLDYVRLLGPKTVFRGSAATYRVLAVDPESCAPLEAAAVTIRLIADGSTVASADGSTDSFGRFIGTMDIPSDAPDTMTCRCTLSGGGVNETIEREITAGGGTKVLLTTDKPQYQPGQTIHLRALALTEPGCVPVADEETTLEIYDAKDNKVFKEIAATNSYGIANASFVLAPELCSGNFKLSANVGGTIIEKSVLVAFYVLPKFKVNFTSDRDYYIPGETATASVHLQYFFGKDIDGGTLDINVRTGSGDDAQTFANFLGTTNPSGVYAFNFQVPNSFDPVQLANGEACISVAVIATDTADQVIEKEFIIPVAGGEAIILAAPEGGRARLGADNLLYVAVADPAGRPIENAVIEALAGSNSLGMGQTDAAGFAEITIHPEVADCTALGSGLVLELTVNAALPGGGFVSDQFTTGTAGSSNFLFVRPNAALYKVGETLQADVIASDAAASVKVELCSRSRVLAEKTVDLALTGVVDFTLTQEHAGDCYIVGNFIAPDGMLVTDSRQVFIAGADDLVISVTPDKSEYVPGEHAQIALDVSDRGGAPVQAALGVTIVDEAVYHVSDFQAGAAEEYFNFDWERGITLPAIGYSYDEFVKVDPDAATQNAARLYFSIVGSTDTISTSLGDSVAVVMTDIVRAEVEDLIDQLVMRGLNTWPEVGYTAFSWYGWDPALAIDPWGKCYIITADGSGTLSFKSGGPDEKFDTDDDIVITK